MSSSLQHDNLCNQVILAVGSSGLARVWKNEVGLFRLFDRPSQIIKLGVPGVSDILGFLRGGRFLAIEIKTGSGKLRQSQINFRRVVQEFGGLFVEGRSVEQVLAEIGK